MEFSREDPEYARFVIEKLVPDLAQRRAVLELFAHLVQVANACPDKWGITLGEYEVVLNMGGGFYGLALLKGELKLYWLGADSPEPPGTAEGFERLKGSRRCRMSVSDGLLWKDTLLPRIEGLFSFANSWSKAPLIPSARRSHSAGMLRYMESELELAAPLPDPMYPPNSDTSEVARYWVGGHQWEDKSMLPEFLAESSWWHGFDSPDWGTQARVTFERYAQIEVGDYFAIKGYGGAGTLKIHFAGRVSAKDEAQKKVVLEKLPLPSPQSIHPARGTGSWFGTLREVTDVGIIDWMFHGKPYKPETESREEDILLPPTPELNTILYGPPGTGKTYETAKRAVEIIDGTADSDRKVLMARYRELQQAGRIAFVTFHQSYSYEDFVEGIRPVMDDSGGDAGPRYQVVDGILKELSLKATQVLLKPKAVPAGVITFSMLWAELLDRIDKVDEYRIPGLGSSEYLLADTPQGNLTGTNEKGNAKQPYNASRKKVEQVWMALPANQKPNHTVIKGILGVGSHTNLIGAVIEELRKIGSQLGAAAPVQPTVPTRDDVLAVMENSSTAEFEWIDKAPNDNPFVLIIDEINRGNISKILGELITLLEDDKRLGEENELTVTLPYSRETFGLPSNLYLIGTMNTADKSLALLDVALRRRFAFEELPPRFEVCGLEPELEGLLVELNRRITLRKDRDHRIGHAFFRNVGADEARFNQAFARKVIPLLQEYFYNDWEGLRYVLGEQNGAPRFIQALEGAGESGARNRWQWYFDAGKTLNPADTLKANYALPPAA